MLKRQAANYTNEHGFRERERGAANMQERNFLSQRPSSAPEVIRVDPRNLRLAFRIYE
jgi:hypothetical protein